MAPTALTCEMTQNLNYIKAALSGKLTFLILLIEMERLQIILISSSVSGREKLCRQVPVSKSDIYFFI